MVAGGSKCALIMETTAVTELQDAVKVAEMVESNPFWVFQSHFLDQRMVS